MDTAKPLQKETRRVAKRRGFGFWIGRLALVFGLGLLFYYGYCWGLWGRSSLLLQYLFQCSCPAASEEARYPEELDVIVPACRNINVGLKLSPSGRFLYLREEKNGLASVYLLDLQTLESLKVTDQPFSSFLTDDLWFVESGLEYYIMDQTTSIQYPIQKFVHSRPDAQIKGDTNLPLLIENLQQARDIYFIDNSTDTVVALAPDFLTHPEHSFLINRFDIPGIGSDTYRMERFLLANHIFYNTVLKDFPHEVVSPDGRLIARDDGIYLVETDQIIVKAPPSLVRGWTYDGRGVIYASSRCLFRIGFPFADDTACFRWVPQPVLKLKVPEQYLQSIS